jgi:hypothetical protein
MTRFPKPAGRDERRKLERSIGHPIYQSGEYGYTSLQATVRGGESFEFECDFDRRLHLFDLRSFIADRLESQKLKVRFAFGGELHITGLTGGIELDGLNVQRRLRLRVVEYDPPGQDSWIVGRHDTRVFVAGSLSNAVIRDRAVGEMAEPIDGAGLPRGEVVRVSETEVILRAGSAEVPVNPSDYTLSVRSSYVKRYHKPQTMSKLQVIAGSLTESGQRNRYAVKDRYLSLIDAMDQVGWMIPMSSDRTAIIEREWTEIRIQVGG